MRVQARLRRTGSAVRARVAVVTVALVGLCERIRHVEARWQVLAQARLFFEYLRLDPSRFAAMAGSVLVSGFGLAAAVLSRLTGDTIVTWTTAVLYGAVFATLYFLGLVVVLCAVVRQSRDPGTHLARRQRVVFFPGWRKSEPRFLCDARDGLVQLSQLTWLQPLALAFALAAGWDTARLAFAAFGLSIGTIFGTAILMYAGTVPLGPIVPVARRLQGIDLDQLTMWIDFVEPDASRSAAWTPHAGLHPFKKLLGDELRNVYLLDSPSPNPLPPAGGEGKGEGGIKGAVASQFPVNAADLELTVGVEDEPGDYPDRGYREREAAGDVEVRFDDEVVLRRSLRSLAEGWNDFAALERPSGVPQVSRVTFSSTGNRHVYFGIPRRVHRQAEPRTIVLVIVDSLRRDRVGLYSGRADLTPGIDAFFARSARYDRAHAQAEWTKAAFASILTGLYPSHHAITNHWFNHRRLGPEPEPFPAILQRHGFYSCAFMVGGGRSSQEFGFDRGFDRFVLRNGHEPGNVSHLDVTARLLRELDEHQDEHRFFFFHYGDLHYPYAFSSPFASRGTALMERSWHDIFAEGRRSDLAADADYFVTLYDSKVREIDLHLRTVFDAIERSSRRDSTAVILTADHAMGLPADGAPGWLRKRLGDALLRVPLLVRVPWRADLSGHVFRGLVEASIDLYPTILELADIPSAPPGFARSLLPRADLKVSATSGDPADGVGKEFAVSEAIFDRAYEGRVVSEGGEYVRRFNWTTGEQHEDFFNLDGADPEAVRRALTTVVRDRRLARLDDDPTRY